MTIRLSRRRARALAVVLTALISLLCVLLMTGCGTSRESGNSYKQTTTAVDETGAVQTLRTISTAQASFAVGHGGEYGSFEDLTGSGLLDKRFAAHTPEVGGYVFTIKLAPASGDQASMYAAYADPKTPASGVQTNGRHLYMDSTSSIIHANNSQQASASDPAFP
jgi:hypothetical protein